MGRPKKKRARSSSNEDDAIPIKELPAPDESVFTNRMKCMINLAKTDIEKGMTEIEEHSRGLSFDVSRVMISTITFECSLIGPKVDIKHIVKGLESPGSDIMVFNDAYLGKQPSIGGGAKKFSNSLILVLRDVKPNNDLSIKLFYPKPTLHITGPTSIDRFLKVAEYGRRMLSITGGSLVKDDAATGEDGARFMDSFKVNMINTNFSLGFKLNVHQTKDLLNSTHNKGDLIVAIFNPELYAGIQVSYLCDNYSRTSIMIFQTGNVIITGPSGAMIAETFKFLTRLFEHNMAVVRKSAEDDFDAASDDDDDDDTRRDGGKRGDEGRRERERGDDEEKTETKDAFDDDW